jgi:hypothetical protein
MKKLVHTLKNERGEYYHAHWMAVRGIPPVPLWLVGWLVIPLERYLAQRTRDDEIPF